MNNKGYIYVFDYTNCQIIEFSCDDDNDYLYFEDMNQYVDKRLEKEKLNYNDCYWMHSFNRLNIDRR